MRRLLIPAIIISSSLLAACGGGGSTVAPPGSIGAAAPDQSFATGASSVHYYPLGSDASLDVSGLDIIYGQDGDLYYSTLGPTQCNPSGFCSSTAGAYGQFIPSTKAFTEIPIDFGAPQSVYMTPDGAIWGGVNSELDNNIGSIVRISPFNASSVTQIPLPPEPSASPEARDVTYDPVDSNVYFTDKFGHRVGKIPAAGPYTTAAMTMYAVPNGPAGTPGFKASPHGITAASDGNVYFADFINGVVYQLTTGGALTGYVTPEQLKLGSSNTAETAYPRAGSDGRIYVTQVVGAFDAMTSGGAFSPFTIAPNAVPYFERSGSGLVVWDDLGNYAIGMYSLSTGTIREIPTAAQVGSTMHIPNGVVPTSATSVWFMCYGPAPAGKPICMGHLALTSKWSVFPGTQITLKTGKHPTHQLIGIGESGNSGPFSVVSEEPSTVTVTAVSGLDHNFVLTPGTVLGNATVNVTDAHNNTTTINVTVK